MIREEDQCVGCPPEIGCLGRVCPRRRVMVLICDRCGSGYRVEEGIGKNGEDLCYDCLAEEEEEDGNNRMDY